MKEQTTCERLIGILNDASFVVRVTYEVASTTVELFKKDHLGQLCEKAEAAADGDDLEELIRTAGREVGLFAPLSYPAKRWTKMKPFVGRVKK